MIANEKFVYSIGKKYGMYKDLALQS